MRSPGHEIPRLAAFEFQYQVASSIKLGSGIAPVIDRRVVLCKSAAVASTTVLVGSQGAAPCSDRAGLFAVTAETNCRALAASLIYESWNVAASIGEIEYRERDVA